MILDSRRTMITATLALLTMTTLAAAGAAGEVGVARTGQELYLSACASCHGADGRGAPASLTALETPVPDFTDCSFNSREPRGDWAIIAHEGGPVRGFSELMPAFGGVFSMAQLARIIEHVKGFCTDSSWPPGEFNLPKGLVTGKAFPEDESMIITTVDTEGSGSISNKIIHEKRFGARNQWEIVIPFGWWEADGLADGGDGSGWTSGVGDVAVALKRAFYHNLDKGSILAVTGELILPTGDEDRGNGSGTTVVEPFLTYGQILPAGFFFQSQLGAKVPFDRDLDDEAFVRANFGRSFTSGPFGRTWSPMVAVLASRDLASGATTHWDAVPQMQITLNTRQHIMMNLGVRLPINDSASRDTKIILYLLWDWFDGGLGEGW